MHVRNYRPVEKGCLRGFATVFVDKWGLEICDMGIFQKDEKRWISFPQKTYEKDGKTCYYPYMKFAEGSHMKRFQESLLDSVDKWIKDNPILAPQQAKEQLEEELPF